MSEWTRRAILLVWSLLLGSSSGGRWWGGKALAGCGSPGAPLTRQDAGRYGLSQSSMIDEWAAESSMIREWAAESSMIRECVIESSMIREWVVESSMIREWLVTATADAAGTAVTLVVATAIPDRSGAATPAVKTIFWARVRAICMATPYTAIGTGDPVVTK